MRAVARATSGPASLFGLGVLLWPVMTFYTNSTIHMIAHGSWAQVLMLAGGAELGLVRGKLHTRYWRLCTRARVARLGCSAPRPRAEAWFFARAAFLHHLLGWTIVVGAVFPLVQVFRPRSVVAAAGFALDGDRRLGDALLRSRRRADLRPPLAARRGCSTDEARARVSRRSRRSPCRRRRSRTRALRESPAFRERLAHSPRDVDPALRPVRRPRCRTRSSCSRPAGRTSRRRRARCPASTRSSRACRSCRAARTPCAGTRSRTTVTSSPASTRSACACARRRRPTPSARRARRAPSTSSAGCTSSRSRSLVGGLGLPAARRSRAAAARAAERRFFWVDRASASSSCSRRASSRSCCAPRTRCSCRSAASSTATSRRSPAGRASATAFIAMTLGFAFVAALLFLAWLTDRRVLLWPAFVLGARLRVRALALRPLGRRRRALVALGARRLGAPVRRDALDRRARAARGRRLAGGARAAAHGVPALLAARDRARRAARSPPGST